MLLPLDQHLAFEAVEHKWGDLCRQIATPMEIPDGWLQAMIYRESGGNAKARNREKTPDDPADDGIGLLQITSQALKRGFTDEQLFDPATNIRVGAKYVAFLGAIYKWDFASVAAAFNAGSVRPSSQNRWGMVMTAGHVSSEVAAYNYFLILKADDEKKAAMAAVAQQFNLFELLDGKAGDDAVEKV